MDLSDALDGWPPGGNQPSPNSNNSGGTMWPGSQPASNPSWPSGPSQNNPAWPGGQASQGGGGWPGGPSTQQGGGGWPGSTPTQQGGGGGGWPGSTPTPQGGGGAGWPGAPPTQQGGGGWPGAPPTQQGGGGWPGAPPTQQGGGGGGQVPTHGLNLKVPYSHPLPSGFQDKMLFTIQGTINPHADRFSVDLMAGKDIVFHFNPRFNEGGKKVLVRNSRIGNAWGKEEREAPPSPFNPGQRFEMKLLCNSNGFKVAVNNSHVLDFCHRVRNLRSITSLDIHGDVTLAKVIPETLH